MLRQYEPEDPRLQGDLSEHALFQSYNVNDEELSDFLPSIPMLSSFSIDMSLDSSLPTSPPEAAPAPPERKPKTSPLLDLIETERTYVDYLMGIIKKVAAAWSRSNMPPHELDNMFRRIEGVYKIHRHFLTELSKIDAISPSPKDLGDLLMRWIDDLETPYTSYCSQYRQGFDDWLPVRSNVNLAGVLKAFSTSHPPFETGLRSPDPAKSSWTLDTLFSLPTTRLKYYRKLYSRLLSTTPLERSDHTPLVIAIDKLDKLLAIIDSRAQHELAHLEYLEGSPAFRWDSEPVHEKVLRRSSSFSKSYDSKSRNFMPRLTGDSSYDRRRLSQGPEAKKSRGRVDTPLISVAELEQRLSVDQTIDIFTMKPKSVRLQLSSSTLPFTREVHFLAHAVVRFVPRVTGQEVVHRRGSVYILSDLFLICESIEAAEITKEGPDLSLCYPPLAGKVLQVSEIDGQDYAVRVVIMRTEHLILEVESADMRNDLITKFNECISFSISMCGSSKAPSPINSTDETHVFATQNELIDGRDGFSQAQRLELQTHSKKERSEWTQPSMRIDQDPRDQIAPSSSRQTPVQLPQFQTSDILQERVVLPPQRVASRGQIPSRSSSLADHQSALNQEPSGSTSSAHQSSDFDSFEMGISQISGPLQFAIEEPFTIPLPSFRPVPIIPPSRKTSMGFLNSSLELTPTQYPINSSGEWRHPSRGHLLSNPSPSRGQPFVYRRPSFHEDVSPHELPHEQTFSHQSSLQYSSSGRMHVRPITSSSAETPGSPHIQPPARPPSEPSSLKGSLQRWPSSHSLASQYDPYPWTSAPPLPVFMRASQPPGVQRVNSSGSFGTQTILPSMQMVSRINFAGDSHDSSPPTSPTQKSTSAVPVTNIISAQMKCKVFLQQQHSQWKALGSAKLTLYHQHPTNVKQLVAEVESKKSILISTIVLTDGVERVGKTGIAIELSDDKGARTGIIYMIQLRDESSAGGLFERLLEGSDRALK